jgi:hypothetical protein
MPAMRTKRSRPPSRPRERDDVRHTEVHGWHPDELQGRRQAELGDLAGDLDDPDRSSHLPRSGTARAAADQLLGQLRDLLDDITGERGRLAETLSRSMPIGVVISKDKGSRYPLLATSIDPRERYPVLLEDLQPPSDALRFGLKAWTRGVLG